MLQWVLLTLVSLQICFRARRYMYGFVYLYLQIYNHVVSQLRDNAMTKKSFATNYSVFTQADW